MDDSFLIGEIIEELKKTFIGWKAVLRTRARKLIMGKPNSWSVVIPLQAIACQKVIITNEGLAA